MEIKYTIMGIILIGIYFIISGIFLMDFYSKRIGFDLGSFDFYKKHKFLYWSIVWLGFMLFIPYIGKILSDKILVIELQRLRYYYSEAKYHNMEGRFDNELIGVQRKLKIISLKRKARKNKFKCIFKFD